MINSKSNDLTPLACLISDIKQIILLTITFVFSLPLYCSAGRPVYKEISLVELTQAAQIVAIVTKATPFEITARGKYDCDQLSWRLKVKEILKSLPEVIGVPQNPDTIAPQDLKNLAKPGATIEVNYNVTSLKDCIFREGWKTTGASFLAIRYLPSDPQTVAKHNEIIVFLVVRDGRFQLVADAAFETIGKRKELESILDQRKD